MSQSREMGKDDRLESPPQCESKWSVWEGIASLWAMGVMGYYYYSEGHVERVVQIWRLFFG
mgnify:CR=1 FL=1|jgi:hypothetical protein